MNKQMSEETAAKREENKYKPDNKEDYDSVTIENLKEMFGDCTAKKEDTIPSFVSSLL